MPYKVKVTNASYLDHYYSARFPRYSTVVGEYEHNGHMNYRVKNASGWTTTMFASDFELVESP